MSIKATSLPSAGKTYVIASVYSISNSTVRNASRHASLQAHLERENIPFRPVSGRYRYKGNEFSEGRYVTEHSFLFPADYWPVLASWFRVYKQETVLVLGELTAHGRRATLHYLTFDALPVDLGWFHEVSRDVALANDAEHTFDPEQGTYFIASK